MRKSAKKIEINTIILQKIFVFHAILEEKDKQGGEYVAF